MESLYVCSPTACFVSEGENAAGGGVLRCPLSPLPYLMNDLGRRHLREAHFNYAAERGAAESASAGLFMKMERKKLGNKTCREKEPGDAKARRRKGIGEGRAGRERGQTVAAVGSVGLGRWKVLGSRPLGDAE